jgi:transposase InsO family protein
LLKEEFRVTKLCEVLAVSRSAYYAYLSGATYSLSDQKTEISEAVKEVFGEHKKRYGWRRIQAELADQNLRVGRHQIRSRMKEQNLIAIQPKSFVPKTTQSHPHLRRSPNLLLQPSNLPIAPRQVIVGDITYLPNEEEGYGKWLYLAVWLDLYSRRIVGWHLDRHMEESLVINALKQVLKEQQCGKNLIVHSDGGGQYGANDFRALLQLNGFRQSMTRKDNHYDNAHAESLFSRFKAELLDGGIFHGWQDACDRTFEYIEGYYNTRRRHSSIEYLSPAQYEQRFWENAVD